MLRNDFNDITDEEFWNIVQPCEKQLHDYIVDNILDNYVAYHFAIYFNANAMWDQNFSNQVSTAVEDLAQISIKDCNFENIKRILLEKYNLKVVCESPLDVVKVKG